MKKIVKILTTAILAAATLAPLAAEEKAKTYKRDLTPAKSWTLYLPGKGNKKDVVKDLNKAGWQVSNTVEKHFSLVDTNLNGKKALKLQTLDGKNDAIILPLTGDEKKVTVIFKAKGAVNPDRTTTPMGVLYGFLQHGAWQSIIRHNHSNQLKGSKGQSRLGNQDIVSDWHDFRWVFDIPDGDGSKMTAKCYVDGELKHTDVSKQRNEFTDSIDWDTMTGKGNFLEFGENDGSTNGYARYAYILVICDEDVENVSLEDLGKKVKADLVTNPEMKDGNPPSKRPANKPAGINIQGPEVGRTADFEDENAISRGKISLKYLPLSFVKTSTVTETPVVPEMNFAAVVDASGATAGSVKTIKEAIDKVPEGSAIKVMPGLYYEKLVITKPGISLIGTNPASTIIYGYEADAGGIDGNLLVEVNLLPKGLVTEPGKPAPIPDAPVANCYFKAANITFYNKGPEWNKLWGGSERRSIALALKGVDQCYLENCMFLGQQDTLYWRSGRVYAKNCFIEGDVDFICGGATVFFDKCEIYTLKYANGGIITAAAAADTGYKSTAAFANGYVFNECKFNGDESFEKAAKKVVLARGTWVGGSATSETQVGKNVLINCEMANIFYAPEKVYNDWDITNTADKCFFKEFGSTGPGANPARPQLNASEAKILSNPESVLGFKPEL